MVRGSGFLVVPCFFLLTMKNKEVQNTTPISFSKGEGHKFTEFACLFEAQGCISCWKSAIRGQLQQRNYGVEGISWIQETVTPTPKENLTA